MRQYKFNISTPPSREELIRTKKKASEEIRTYAQRWRTLASQVRPVVQEEEMIELFLKALPYEFYEKVHTSGCNKFEGLVKVCERVERDINEKRTPQETERRPYFPRRGREPANEVAYVSQTDPRPPANVRPPPQAWGNTRNYEPRRRPPPRQFTPLPRPLSQLLPMLLDRRLVAKEVPRIPPPDFAGFDQNKSCEYHMGEKGHDANNCLVLKHKVQTLIDRGMVDFKEPEPNVHQNPLPNHQGVNLIFDDGEVGNHVDDDDEDEIERRRRGNRRFLEEARANGVVIDGLGEDRGAYRFMVRYDPPAWALQPQEEVVPDGWGGMDDEEATVSEMTAYLELEAYGSYGEEESELEDALIEELAEEIRELVLNHSTDYEVATITPCVIHLPNDNQGESQSQEPIVIELVREMSSMMSEKPVGIRPVTIELPPKVSLDLKAVPWDYSSAEIGAITRSGRCYAPKENEVEKKAVTEEDAKQALAVIRTSEFEVVEQLRRMPAQISLLELFRSSEKHKNALFKVLNEVHVPETINESQLENFVGAILLQDMISFSDEDLPGEGRSHNKALYIAVRCSGKEVSRVFVDNGSAFNLCPLSTLRRLGKEKAMKFSKAAIRAFDGMKKDVIGEVELEVMIGPVTFLINFQVVDITSAFNFLLGRPWIHTAGAVPSSLHQSVKFVVNGRLITVHSETDFEGYVGSTIPYVEPESTEEASYHSLELVNVVHTPDGSKMAAPCLSTSAIMTSKVLLEHGYTPGMGLGKDAQGIVEPVTPFKPTKGGGLGYRGEYGENGGDPYGSRGRGRGVCLEGRGRRGRRGGRAISSSVWKGKAKEVRYHEIPLSYTFPGPPKMLQEEESLSEEEEDLALLYEDEAVNVTFSEIGDLPAIE